MRFGRLHTLLTVLAGVVVGLTMPLHSIPRLPPWCALFAGALLVLTYPANWERVTRRRS